MKKSKRYYVPCHRCGATHTNPASSSTCDECGPIIALENLANKREREEWERQYTLGEQNEY